MGLFDTTQFTQIPQAQRQKTDDNSFSQLYNAYQSLYQAQDPLDRMNLRNAQMQQQGSLDALVNGNQGQRSSEDSGGQEYFRKPFSNDPTEQKYINDEWNKKWGKSLTFDGTDSGGNPFSTSATFTPLKFKDYEQDQISPDQYNQIKQAYDNYGPSILQYIFS